VPTLERVTFTLLLCFVASLQISIAAANVLLFVLLVCWLAGLVREHSAPSVPRAFWPLIGYALATLVVSAFSLDPRTSFIDDKQLVLFAIVPAVYSLARGSRASLVVDVIVSVGAASAAFGIIQYGLLHYDNLGRRPEGAMSHYMTYSGLLMLVICAAVRPPRLRAARAHLAGARHAGAGRRPRAHPGRSAWVGASAAIAVLLALKDVRLHRPAAVLVFALFVVAPGTVTKPGAIDFRRPGSDQPGSARDGRDRRQDHQGPSVDGRRAQHDSAGYEQYRPDYAVNPTNPHLHNVPLQIGAERGLPALALWLWFIGALAVGTLSPLPIASTARPRGHRARGCRRHARRRRLRVQLRRFRVPDALSRAGDAALRGGPGRRCCCHGSPLNARTSSLRRSQVLACWSSAMPCSTGSSGGG
jgi:hypothetical protein